MFDTVLVANRGEIAVRIMRTLRRLGIRSVAVYSDADAGARHVREADQAIRLGPAPAAESYLNPGRILAAAATAGAQAVHPGYGFLAENAAFAEACEAARVAFVGPPAPAIAVMGDKIRAKAAVAAAGVPVVPGTAEPGLADEQLLAAADGIGFPLLVKPSAGGGGKGMRTVARPGDLADALVSARREAAAAFGDDTLLLERYLEAPRHIEVQVLADAYGAIVHLGERECSLQRRHQKVIEEAPSPFVDGETRRRLGAAASAAAASVGYRGAGTVEFIVAAEHPGQFFFIEMNTRLQVEHPVTEMVTGIDLVEQQLRVAAGERLAFSQDQVRWRGHSVEARVYAEDPARGFLPTGGRVLLVREPSGEGLRVDSSLARGLDVATAYDPMLAKVVAWGPDRASALARLGRALAGTVVLGVGTNAAFLRRLIAHPDVAAGRLDTGLIERVAPSLVGGGPRPAVLATYGLVRLLEAWPAGGPADLWDVPSGWRAGRDPHPLRFAACVGGGPPVTVEVTGTPAAARVAVGGGPPLPASIQPGGDGLLAALDGVADRVWTAADGAALWLFAAGEAWRIEEAAPTRRTAEPAGATRTVRSPMPGTVVALRAASGGQVVAGAPLVVVEAMKMEHVVAAPFDGTVEILVGPGDRVDLDEVVARVEPRDARAE